MRFKASVFGLAAVLLVAAPVALSQFRTEQLTEVGVTFIAILGLDVLVGHAGQISLGHGAFMAVGGYTTAILMADHGVRDLWTIPVAAAVAGAVGLVAGVTAVRLSGFSLALVTFGLAVAFPALVLRFDHFTGGAAGIELAGKPAQTGHGAGVVVLGRHLSNGDWGYGLTWTVAVACFLLVRWLLSSRFGRALRAVRDDERAAATSGISRAVAKVGALGVSAALAGTAGSLLAIDTAQVGPGTFSAELSLYLLAGAVVGFFCSVRGAIVGALLLQFLPDLARLLPHVGSREAGPATFVLGLAVVLVTLLLPPALRAGTAFARRAEARTE
ncbi:MAG TPA: branched-chain amino acid ABC transporter permease [Gaiellaceae bacterium]|nr:branched-chain amino acid ABC transporter permease [Gaiellaceae bacterium]